MILGSILWSLNTGTQHRGAFEVPISYRIELESLQFSRLLLLAIEKIGDWKKMEILVQN